MRIKKPAIHNLKCYERNVSRVGAAYNSAVILVRIIILIIRTFAADFRSFFYFYFIMVSIGLRKNSNFLSFKGAHVWEFSSHEFIFYFYTIKPLGEGDFRAKIIKTLKKCKFLDGLLQVFFWKVCVSAYWVCTKFFWVYLRFFFKIILC